ncbi:MAG: hypothetical protein ACR2KQ_09830 [Actinomycetota bacterium]
MRATRASAPVSLVLLVALLMGACSGASTPEPAARPTAPDTAPSPGLEQRGITKPEGVIVENAAQPGTKKLVREAIADLKEVGIWRKLTKHLYGVKFATRPGRNSVPPDGHLADAFLTAKVDGDVGGTYCDIMFFPVAMADDLARWRSYHAQGLVAEPAPTARQFWASIMAHELSHCMRKKRGEKAARAWEKRALEAVISARLE